MSKFPIINFDLNVIFIGFTDKANSFIKELTPIPSDSIYMATRNGSPIEIHLNKWFGKDTSYIYREVFEEVEYDDKKILASYIELERFNKKTNLFMWHKLLGDKYSHKTSRLIIEPNIGSFYIKRKT